MKALVSHVPEDNISLTLSENQLTVQNTQSSKSKDQLTFSEWQSAFHIYMAVFIETFSDQAPHIHGDYIFCFTNLCLLTYIYYITIIYRSRGQNLSAHA